MKFTLSKKLLKQFPNLREGVLIVKGMDNSVGKRESFQFLANAQNLTRANPPKRGAWFDAFTQIGLNPEETKPSHRALIERVIEPADLPSINTLVNTINAVQIRTNIPIGAHDLDKIEGDITVGPNTKGLSFNDRANGKTKVDKKEICHTDSKEVLTRNWVWRQGKRDLCDEKTQNVVIFINTIDSEKIEEIAIKTVSLIEEFTGKQVDAKLGTMSAKNPMVKESETKLLKKRVNIEVKVSEVSSDKKIIDRILNKAVEEIFPSKEALEKKLLSGEKLKIYQGFDPTAPTLHIGHTVMMRKLEDFRKLGHEVIFLMGNFTAMIGDPTDKKAMRTKLSIEETNANLKKYKEQANAIIDVDNKQNPVKIMFNFDWLSKLTFAEVVDLASHFTVQQMSKRNMFQKRLEEDKPIGLHEFMYPLMQGYDSVAMGVDIEVGGNDQLFNMLAGRHLVKEILNKEKFVITGKLLTTSDGAKMGKSEGNMIKLSDNATDIYGKVMAFPDEHIAPAFELLTDSDMEEVKTVEKRMKKENPMILKKELALKLTTELKGEKAAIKAQEQFEEIFQKNNIEVELEEKSAKGAKNILDIMTNTGISKSKSIARRLIEQGAVQIDGEKVTSWQRDIRKKEFVIKAGKKVVRVK